MKRIRFSMLVLSGTLALPAIGLLIAAAQPEHAAVSCSDEEQVASGTIKSVDSERNRFVLSFGDEREDLTLRVNQRTQYTLDGEESTMEEALKEGHTADVSHRNDVAVRVDATSTSSSQPTFADDDEQTANGTIKSVDAERNRFVLLVGEGDEELTLRVTERTTYTLDGEESTMEEALKEGNEATVRHRNNLALRVDATTRTR